MSGRLFYALDRMPRVALADRLPSVRLPSVPLGAAPIRFGTEPMPPDAMPKGGDHTARLEAASAWLVGQCGAYAPLRARFVASYFAWIATEIAAHWDELAARLARFGGLYAPEDWTWSALRPLPRALVPEPVDFAFWDGAAVTAILLGETKAPENVPAIRLAPGDLGTGLGARLPDAWGGFWGGEILPVTPFRRPIPPAESDQMSIVISST